MVVVNGLKHYVGCLSAGRIAVFWTDPANGRCQGIPHIIYGAAGGHGRTFHDKVQRPQKQVLGVQPIEKRRFTLGDEAIPGEIQLTHGLGQQHLALLRAQVGQLADDSFRGSLERFLR
ncbi:hypothetical protein D3C77_404120 [compost metagenome]